jgi:hypothetical protein
MLIPFGIPDEAKVRTSREVKSGLKTKTIFLKKGPSIMQEIM